MKLATQLKTVVLCCIIQGVGYAQEKSTALTPPMALAHKFDAKLNQITSKKLLDFAARVKQNPGSVSSIVSIFYTQTCQSPENRTIRAYARSPLLNLRKCRAYFTLSQQVNEKIYLPHVHATLEKMNRPIDPDSYPQEMKNIHEEYLATLTDHPVLAQQAKELFSQEWAFSSVRLDLASHLFELADLHEEFKKQKNRLALSEQNESELHKFELLLDKKIDELRSTLYAITYREKIAAFNKDVFATVAQHIKTNSLEDLQSYMIGFPLTAINALCKTQNKSGNGLLHEICISTELAEQQKKEAVCFLEEYGLYINEHNNAGKTPLDLVDGNNTALREFLHHLGAQQALPKVTTLKKSFDTPPASPDNGSQVKLKRSVSFQQDITN